MDRRDFLKFLGMASSATVLSSCGVEKTTERIIPFLIPPDEGYIPGEAMYKNAACSECPAGCGASVKIVDFNPIKLEGNPQHPLNDGALCLRGQASLMRLYHPQRVKTPLLRNKRGLILEEMTGGKYKNISWEDAYQLILKEMKKASESGKQNVYFSGATNGSLSVLIEEFCRKAGVERLPEYEVFSHAALRQGYDVLFGKPEVPAYGISRSGFLLTIGADILETFINPVQYAKEILHARENQGLKWVHLEPHASLTGFQADERLVLRPGSEPYLLLYLLNYILSNNLTAKTLPVSIMQAIPRINVRETAEKTGLEESDITGLAQQFGKSLAENPTVIAGGVATAHRNGLETAVLTGLLQWATGMIGNTVDFSRSLNFDNVGTLKDVAELSSRLQNGQIGVMFVANTDPVATVPGALGFSENFEKAAFRVAFTDMLTPTAEACDLILPLSHPFETWDDTAPRKGVLNISQPVIEVLYDTRSQGDILLNLTELSEGKQTQTLYQDWLKSRWQQIANTTVEELIANGFYEEPVTPVSVRLQAANVGKMLRQATPEVADEKALLIITPSIRAYDGRSEVLPLAHEIPDPLTSVSYGHWISISKELAEELNLPERSLVHKHRDVVNLKANGQSMNLPVMLQPGLPGKVMTIQREQVNPAMMNYDPRTGEELCYISGVEVTPTGQKKPLAIISGGFDQEDREIIPKGHGEAEEHHHVRGDETLYPPHEHPKYRWALGVDLESCTGCSACVAACYIENNIPCVGEQEHLKGREMAWIRIQPYYDEHENLDTLVMMCQQCDAAPCENVCPVFATYHNDEGLNVMVYNRCVGTRYCHNNCPYKVRRFNWFDWTNEGYWQEPMTRMANPEIWVRPKGVMEKCTFCVQRIRKAKDFAKDEGRDVHDGEIVPACAQSCPTEAIVFGNILDKNSKIYQFAQSERKFRVLEVLGTRPAVHYLRKEDKA